MFVFGYIQVDSALVPRTPRRKNREVLICQGLESLEGSACRMFGQQKDESLSDFTNGSFIAAAASLLL